MIKSVGKEDGDAVQRKRSVEVKIVVAKSSGIIGRTKRERNIKIIGIKTGRIIAVQIEQEITLVF